MHAFTTNGLKHIYFDTDSLYMVYVLFSRPLKCNDRLLSYPQQP